MKTKKYYLITAKRHLYGKKKIKYDGFKEIKAEALEKLNCRMWVDQDKVDLRSLNSCVRYINDDFESYTITVTTSFNKYIDW